MVGDHFSFFLGRVPSGLNNSFVFFGPHNPEVAVTSAQKFLGDFTISDTDKENSQK